ncbi:MAG: hypothetical protein AAF702_39665 [Chloroflexota bacterium]
MTVYRFEHNDVGIYEAVEIHCPRDDARRVNKPDGSWLPKVGPKYPSAISLWTEAGLRIYQRSGLLGWHLSVLPSEALVQLCTVQGDSLYEDEFQILAEANAIRIVDIVAAENYRNPICVE